MPKERWNGYGRFCPLARALDVVGERWTLVIVQELMKRPSRYGEIGRRLPGIGTTVLADRLRKLEAADVIERRTGPVGAGVLYVMTERGLALEESLAALRRWGVAYLVDPTADGGEDHAFDVHYVDGIDALEAAEFGLTVEGRATTLRFANGRVEQLPGRPKKPVLIVNTSQSFMDRWAGGDASWDDGLADGDVTLTGRVEAWPRWLAATGYLLAYETEASNG